MWRTFSINYSCSATSVLSPSRHFSLTASSGPLLTFPPLHNPRHSPHGIWQSFPHPSSVHRSIIHVASPHNTKQSVRPSPLPSHVPLSVFPRTPSWTRILVNSTSCVCYLRSNKPFPLLSDLPARPYHIKFYCSEPPLCSTVSLSSVFSLVF